MARCLLARDSVSSDEYTFPLLKTATVRFSDESSEPLFTGGIATRQEINYATRELAKEMYSLYRNKNVMVAGILEGGVPFQKSLMECMGRLVRKADKIKMTPATLKIESYLFTGQAGPPRVTSHLSAGGRPVKDLTGYHLLVVDDILDTGDTIRHIPEYLAGRRFRGKAESVCYCFLFQKETSRRSRETDEFLSETNPVNGISVPDEFVVGSGLDFTLPGDGSVPDLHLFRRIGDVYAFNRKMAEKLKEEYKRSPKLIGSQLKAYVTNF
jgi:hypoxanthine phosphoribosyltransferase